MTTGIEVIPAASRDHAERAAVWNDAFSDYYTPGSFTAESLAGFERAFSLDLDASRLVLENGRPVAFGMLGIRDRRSWVGGMGVIPAARRSGHGRRVMEALVASARERGMDVLALEVLVQNVKAVPLYEGLGFRTLRQLEVWDRPATALAPERPVPAAASLPLDQAVRLANRWRPSPLPWQRELAPSIAAFPDMQALVAGKPAGAVAIFRVIPERIGLLEIGADPAAAPADRDRALDTVLATMFADHPARLMRLLNLPEGEPAGPALERAGAAVVHRQWDMELPLR